MGRTAPPKEVTRRSPDSRDLGMRLCLLTGSSERSSSGDGGLRLGSHLSRLMCEQEKVWTDLWMEDRVKMWGQAATCRPRGEAWNRAPAVLRDGLSEL